MRILSILVVLFLALACQPKTGAVAGEAADNKKEMATIPVPSAWVIKTCEQNGKSIPAVNSKGFIAIREGQIGGNSGCNTFGGDWTGSAAKMKVPGVMSTKMYCQDAAEQEQMVFDLLNGTVTTKVSGNELTMSGSGITLTLMRNDKLLK
ncbi:META domain-containing protein [Neolewinella persica]|uniref:META domain-containing protein n=1 Tax=Neolewinella persica TaxID=70998 RepID=UPI000373C63A|nr:META domain-containing protein [Neolewinella persica]